MERALTYWRGEYARMPVSVRAPDHCLSREKPTSWSRKAPPSMLRVLTTPMVTPEFCGEVELTAPVKAIISAPQKRPRRRRTRVSIPMPTTLP